jgi:hypothetical protein
MGGRPVGAIVNTAGITIDAFIPAGDAASIECRMRLPPPNNKPEAMSSSLIQGSYWRHDETVLAG